MTSGDAHLVTRDVERIGAGLQSTTTPTMMRRAMIIGGGVIGLTTAWFLLAHGWRVRLMERAPAVGRGASFRNGGQLSYRYVSPMADAGVPLHAVRWLLAHDSPVRLRLRCEPEQWRWLTGFLARCTRGQNARATATLAALGERSRQEFERLVIDAGLADFGWRRAGKLVVYRRRGSFAAAQRRIANSSRQRVLSPRECLESEPALSVIAKELVGGVLTNDEDVADCERFCLRLFDRLTENASFEGILCEAAASIRRRDRSLEVHSASGTAHEVDAVVLAAGTESVRLARASGIRLPIYPLKGYSLTAPIRHEHVPLGASVTDVDRKTLYATIGPALRVSAMADIVGHDDRIDPRRAAVLLDRVRHDMPSAADYQRAEIWAGLRPSTPSGAPIVGESSVPRLWLNVGHGALGFTFACGTSALLARRMSNLHDDGDDELMRALARLR